jgi:site-specific recombinase XerD
MDHSFELIHTPNPAIRERLKRLVVDSVQSLESKRAYGRAVDQFFDWFQKEDPSSRFNKGTVQTYRTKLVNMKLSSSTVGLSLTAIRCLAKEAADNGLLSPELAAGIGRVRSPKRHGLRIGKWLSVPEAEMLMDAPNGSTMKGKRDRALICLLIGCGLRREEAARLQISDIQQREGRWVVVDLVGKGLRVRSIPMPMFATAAIDTWVQAANLKSGCVFRAVNKAGRVSGESITGQAVFEIVKEYSDQIGLAGITPHNLRRTFARLAHRGKSSIDQIQLSMGHLSIATCEKYLGIQQDLTDAPCDHLGLRMPEATS